VREQTEGQLQENFIPRKVRDAKYEVTAGFENR